MGQVLQLRKYLVISIVILCAVFGIVMLRTQADTLFYNGIIYTLNNENEVVEAFVVRQDRIVAVGNTQWLRLRFRCLNEVDLRKKFVIPSFIDSHGHLLELGLSKLVVNLEGTRSETEAQQRVADFIKNTQDQLWIRGRGWDQNLWPSRKFPTAKTLDEISQKLPVYLTRIDGHACWVNSKALSIAGITKNTPDPKGGKIIRESNGNPTGVLLDAAMELVSRYLPKPTDSELQRAIQMAAEDCISYGITTVHDMAIDEMQYAIYKKLYQENKIPIRIYATIDGESELWQELRLQKPLVGYANNFFTVRAVKYYLDGALGSRGAALLQPYSDDPDNRGLTSYSAEELYSQVEAAVRGGYQVCIHAIGDRANTIALDVYEKVLMTKDIQDLRLRIEHAQVLQQADILRFAKLKVIPSMQPVQCISDMFWAEARLGCERIRNAYAWRSLLDAGCIIAGGSDFPIEPLNPFYGIYAATTRKSLDGLPRNAEDVQSNFLRSCDTITDTTEFSDGWYGFQKMERIEAIRAFTTWAAYAAFDEKLKGSIESGKLADFIVLSDDLFTVPRDKIPFIKVEQTFIGGKCVYQQ